MDINKKYIIIFGTLVLLLVIITGGITYYNERKEQVQVSDISDIPDIGQDALSFSQDYPNSFNGFVDFISFCKGGVLSDIEELKNKEIKEVVCTIERELRKLVLKDNTRLASAYIPSFSPLDSVISFKPDKYVGISVDLKDVIRKYDQSLLEKEKLYFCSISEPSWADSFYLQMEPKFDLIFNEGDVSCGGIKMDQTPSINFSGFIPQAESLNIKHYLVNEQTVSEVMNKQSFSEIKEILKDYPIIWQMERPIIP